MSAIYKRELKSYFHSMIGYVFIAFLIAFSGVYFMAYNLNYGYPYFSYVLSGVLIVFVIAIPVLTMRSFAEAPVNGGRNYNGPKVARSEEHTSELQSQR